MGKWRHGLPVPLGQQVQALFDLDDLLGGRADEPDKAFPGGLTQEAQAGTRGQGRPHGFVVGKAANDGGVIVVESQVPN